MANNNKKTHINKKPLQQGATAILVAAVLVIFCYFFVDRQVVIWVYFHRLPEDWFLNYFSQIAGGISILAFITFIVVIIRYFCQKIQRIDKLMMIAAMSVVISDFFAEALKIVFGRYWPATWNNNLSFITDSAYGFQWFHGGVSASFPSGHTTITLAAMTILWLAAPRLRWLAILVGALQIIGLIGMNYHFVGDTIGGGVLGWLVAYYTWLWCQNINK